MNVSNDYIVEGKVWCVCGPQISVNIWYYILSDITGTRDFDQLHEDWSSWMHDTFVTNIIPSTVTFWGTSMRARDNMGGPWSMTFYNGTHRGIGAFGTANLPREMCGITTWLTGIAGRAFRGRTFWPFLPTDFLNTDGSVSASGQTQLALVSGDISPTISLPIATPLEKFNHILYHAASGTYTPINDYLVRARFAQQHRRGDYGKPNIPPF